MSRATATPKRRKKKQKDKKKKGWRSAATSDRHELYELSVQEAEAECDLINQVWKELRTRKPKNIREDFCGTAMVAVEWVKLGSDHTAVGVDIEPSVLKWSRDRLADRLSEDQTQRIHLVQGDVRTTNTESADSILAMNFSYYLIKNRAGLREYFTACYHHLVDDGILLLDAYGGSDAFVEMEEERHLDGFTYVWDQHKYDPISGSALNYIHFRFPDGSQMKRAFEYDWRLWTLPEIHEILLEAGFKKVTFYWEGTDEETDEGNGEWSQAEVGEACPGWVAYLAAEK
jgi:SAM-dependent methyltransferase